MTWIEIAMVGIGAAALVVEVVGMVGARLGRPWGGTISATMRNDGLRWLTWPWMFGVLLGHWYWRWGARDGLWVVVAVGTVAVLGLDVAARLRGRLHPRWAPMVTAIVGAAAGASCWAMGYGP